MSIRIMSWVWDTSPVKGHVELLIELALADFADDSGRCWPSVATVARKARSSERHVQRVIKKLVESGRVTIEENAGPHGVNVYTFADVTLTPRHPDIGVGVTSQTVRGDTTYRGGDIEMLEMSPDPLRTVKEPLMNHQGVRPHFDLFSLRKKSTRRT